MFEQVSHEIKVTGGATKVWELYGTTQMARLAKEALPDTIVKLDILEGEGDVGTVIKITLAGGFSYKEKFTKVDHENRVKETEAIEGRFLHNGTLPVSSEIRSERQGRGGVVRDQEHH
ncbi:hypothetical protein BT93_A2421 [Corymbia citriodora subsp. variegata]|nr:hypothetical protein BT93_A2421 [Corymbia citriodora subsp. variegata]